MTLVKATAVVVTASMAGLCSVHPAAQGRGRARGPKVARIEQVRDNWYWITEGTGGPGASNLAVLVTGNGVVLVDTKNPEWGSEIQRLIRTVTDKPVTTIINSHAHTDHTGSNAEFSKGIEFIVPGRTCRQVRSRRFSSIDATFLGLQILRRISLTLFTAWSTTSPARLPTRTSIGCMPRRRNFRIRRSLG